MIVDYLWAGGKGKKLAIGSWQMAVGGGENLTAGTANGVAPRHVKAVRAPRTPNYSNTFASWPLRTFVILSFIWAVAVVVAVTILRAVLCALCGKKKRKTG